MHCPRCGQPSYHLAEPCSQCQFTGDPALIEELAHVDWVLDEIDDWQLLEAEARQLLEQKYTARQRELEITLGLRLPPFSQEEAGKAWPELIQRETLLQKMAGWLEAGLVDPAAMQSVADQAGLQVDELSERLEDHARPTYPQTDAEHLDLVQFLLEATDYLSQNQGFATPEAQEQVLAPLLREKERLEIKLGLRPKPAPEPPPQEAPEHAEGPEVIVGDLPVPPSPPPLPWRDRLWRTLLSERTLQALLLLGIFLLFSAAISFVVWGWKDFSALMRVAIPTGFTALFFILGWYVRARTHLTRSGIALSAVAALLIPIDFYTIYVNFNIPSEYWPLFWLITSLACLAAYMVATLIIQSQFFGYLVGAAAGSTVLALIEMGHKATGLSLDWRTTGLSGLAVCLIVMARTLGHSTKAGAQAGRLRVLAEPFRNLSLLSAGVLMPLTLGWRYIGRDSYDSLHYAMTLNWWLGGFIFGWGAIHYRSRGLGLLAAISLPVATYLAQAAIFHQAGINPAWHALGWALLVPLYFVTGYKLLGHEDDPIIQSHGRTAAGWGVALLAVAALWSLTDLTSSAAAASSHVVLAGAAVLAALLWRRPSYLYVASFFSLSATTFGITELSVTRAPLTLGWASLAIAHIVIAFRSGNRLSISGSRPTAGSAGHASTSEEHGFAGPLVTAGYAIAALALVPSLVPYDGHLLAYALGNWLGLAAWGARLAQLGQPGFAAGDGRQQPTQETTEEDAPSDRPAVWGLSPPPLAYWRNSIFHWFTALPLPVWLWLLFANRRALDFGLPLALAALAWGMLALSWRLTRTGADGIYRWPWYVTGLLVSLAAPITAFAITPDGFTPAISLLAGGLLYLADAIANRQSWGLAPGGLVTAWGYALLLDRLHLPFDALSFALALLVAVYVLAGLWTERQRSAIFSHRFLLPLYVTAHIVTLFLLWRIYVRPFDDLFFDVPWTDEMRLWGAASQLLLGVVYGLYAWGTYKERWGHVAAWLGAAGGAFIVIIYSTGRGSSAAKGALGVMAFILAERGLYWLRQRPHMRNRRQQAFIRLAWRLYQRPLLVTGWIASAGIIGLALIRNLWLLGGGRVQQIWASAGLLLIAGLYALSARLFRQARFVWLAAVLIFAPWTIVTNLGWFSAYRPTLPGFALSWALLAWALFLTSLMLDRFASRAYSLPLKSVAYILLPFSLLWGIANVDTSRFTFALAIGMYGLAGALDYRRSKNAGDERSILGQTKFLYPALGLIPVWCVYLMAWLLPAARHEHYGLMLLAFGPLGLAAGQWLKHVAPGRKPASGYALPGYLPGYVATIVGTMLVAHQSPLLALVLLFDALLMLASARLFRNPLWVYPAAAVVPVSLLLALGEAGVAGNRHGWWLIGLASIYLALAWALRRVNLRAYGTATLTIGFALVALGLPPSSQDQTGALWGYGSAALLYAISAIWLRQPLLLTPASALAIVPYAISLQKSGLRPEYYGLALFPGAMAALAIGWGLDHRFFDRGKAAFDVRQAFPWDDPARWPVAVADRLLGWWGLPLYTLGLGLATASPIFTESRAGLSALSFVLLMPLYGWAIYRFRLRVWLLATALAGHLAAIYFLKALGWWQYPAEGWFRFLPVTLITTAVALVIERWRAEGSPLHPRRILAGWSRPLYLLVLIDVVAAQLSSLEGTWAGVAVSLTHALLIAVLASFWLSSWMPYISTTLGLVALVQGLSAVAGPIEGSPIALARLALGYGIAGYGLALVRNSLKESRELHPWLAIWEQPLQRSGIVVSFSSLSLTYWLGMDLARWTVRAMLGFPFREIVDLATVQMVVGVLAWLGLLYVAAAFTQRRLRLGYVAIGMLLAAWMLYAFYVQQWDSAARVQWYAIPAGLYLLGIGYLEWRQGNRTLARWIDYAAVLLMMGSLFWQTLLFGWHYALLLGTEGFAAFWWGSARRLRRFLYVGVIGVILSTIAQLINSLWSINQWIVFGVIGLLVVIAAILIERKLEDIRVWREVLETWE